MKNHRQKLITGENKREQNSTRSGKGFDAEKHNVNYGAKRKGMQKARKQACRNSERHLQALISPKLEEILNIAIHARIALLENEQAGPRFRVNLAKSETDLICLNWKPVKKRFTAALVRICKKHLTTTFFTPGSYISHRQEKILLN